MEPDPAPCPRCGSAGERTDGLCTACIAAGLELDLDFLLGAPEPLPPDDSPPGIPGYTLHRPLGMGGMGQVFAATRDADGQDAAVKVLAARWTADPEAAARFAAEARALRGLEHPGIVRIFESGETADGRLFIAMELIQGCDLGALLRAERLDQDRAFGIWSQVCAALEHAHSRGIVHRDVKPSNILTDRAGMAKLADFGLAKELADDLSPYGLTQTRDTFGTPYYIAPEVVQRKGKAGQTADVYAAAVLLYHLLTGSPPLGNYTPLSVAAGLPKSADAALAAALQADPEKRTGTVRELAETFGKIRTRMATGRARRRVWSRAGTGILASAALAGAALTGWWWRERSQRPAPPPVFPDPALATTSQPWVNSLGMQFVPVDAGSGPGVFFSVFETRRRDFEPYYTADRAPIPEWRVLTGERGRRFHRMHTLTAAGWEDNAASWSDPGFAQSPEEPVTGVTLTDAESFCVWLTLAERREGRLKAPQLYRLPTDAEWSLAAGLEEGTGSPRNLSDAMRPAPEPLPGNTAGPEAKVDPWPATFPVRDQSDLFPRTAPAGSFPPLTNGLHDMGGNVSEWVSTVYSRKMQNQAGQLPHTVRGASWATAAPEELRPDHRRLFRRQRAAADTGFRIVLDITGAEKEEEKEKEEAAAGEP